MSETGENVAEQFDITRSDQDAFAYRSQIKARDAQVKQFFAPRFRP